MVGSEVILFGASGRDGHPWPSQLPGSGAPPPVEPPCLTGREDGVGPAGSGDHHGCSQLTRLGRGRS